MKKLSVIIPVYNEEDTIIQVLDLVCNIELPLNMKKEIIIVDDGSTDNTRSLVEHHVKDNYMSLIKTEKITEYCFYNYDIILIKKENEGKGSAVIKGVEASTGDIIIIQDADLELDPNEIPYLIKPILWKWVDVVYGSRFFNGMHEDQKLSFYLGSWFVTRTTNLLYGTRLTDTSTCYKCFRASVLKDCILTESSFGFDPEVTSIVLRRGINILELPISYAPRDKEHGKKIRLVDGLKAIWILFRNRFKSLSSLIK